MTNVFSTGSATAVTAGIAAFGATLIAALLGWIAFSLITAAFIGIVTILVAIVITIVMYYAMKPRQVSDLDSPIDDGEH